MASETLMTNLALPNGSRIANAFDSVGRLTSTRLLTSGSSLLNPHAYLDNLASQRTPQARADASTVTYTYDTNGNLTSRQLGSSMYLSSGYDDENQLRLVSADT
jgi:YD repeat-containing protein